MQRLPGTWCAEGSMWRRGGAGTVVGREWNGKRRADRADGRKSREREWTGMRNQLTEKDVKRIEEEIEYRKLVVRKEALEAVKEARAHGDLSENFE